MNMNPITIEPERLADIMAQGGATMAECAVVLEWHRLDERKSKANKADKTVPKEYGTAQDIAHIFGIKRGTLYNLMNDGQIKGCLLRITGSKSGIRLFELKSIRDFMQSQNAQNHE